MNKQDILIRLLKDNSITEEEFKLLYEDVKNVVTKSNYDVKIDPWFGIFDPQTNDYIGPTYIDTTAIK